MDVEFDELNKDEQEIVLFLDGRKYAYSVSEIKHLCRYVNSNRLKGALADLLCRGLIRQYLSPRRAYGKNEMNMVRIYKLSRKGKNLINCM